MKDRLAPDSDVAFRQVLRNPPRASSATTRAVMTANRSTETGPEVVLRSHLHRRGLRFRKNVSVLPGLRCRPDVVFRSVRVAVFVDGCFWHGCEQHRGIPKRNAAYWRAKIATNRKRDRRIDDQLAAAGWRVVRVWEHDDPAEAADRVTRVVRDRATTS